MKFKLGEFSRKSHSLDTIKRARNLGIWSRLGQGLMWGLTLALGWGAAVPSAIAAEKVILRLGPFEQEIRISDLEQFAKTGELSSSLQLYAPVLTPQVQEALNRRIQVDPNLADKLIEQWLRTPSGKKLSQALEIAVPEATLPQIQAALTLAARQANGLSLVGFLQAYPEENITIDASSLLAIALEFNPTYLQSQALGPLLESELALRNDGAFKSSSFDPSRRGTQTVQQQTLTFQDRQRHRTILVDLYVPTAGSRETRETRGTGGYSDTETRRRGDAGKLPLSASPRLPFTASFSHPYTPTPLVVISPGLGANRKFFAYLAEHLASHGLTVAALEHPDSRIASNYSQMLSAKEFVERPQDVSFILDELAKLNQQPGWQQGKLNTQQVSAIGHSLGGYTALAVAGAEINLSDLRQFCKSTSPITKTPADWLQCTAAELPDRKLQLRDRRVQSAIALNPVVGNLFGKTGLSQVAAPVLLLGSSEDAITPLLDHQLRPFVQLRSQKYLLTAIGATHLSISDAVSLNSTVSRSTFVKERQGEATKPLRQLVQGVSLAFIKQLTPEAKIYEPFLTSAYAESFSTPALPLRLNTELPASISAFLLFE